MMFFNILSIFIVSVHVILITIYLSQNNNKYCHQSKFSEWQKHLKIWETTFKEYDSNIFGLINNKKQFLNEKNCHHWLAVCDHISNLKLYIKIIKYKPCTTRSFRDYFNSSEELFADYEKEKLLNLFS